MDYNANTETVYVQVDPPIEYENTRAKVENVSSNGKKWYKDPGTIITMVLLLIVLVVFISLSFFIVRPMIWPDTQVLVLNNYLANTIDCGDKFIDIMSAQYIDFDLNTFSCTEDLTPYAKRMCNFEDGIDKCVFSIQWIKNFWGYNSTGIPEECRDLTEKIQINYNCVEMI